MKPLQSNVFEQLLEVSAEPVLVANVALLDWPVVFCNAAFDSTSGMPKNEVSKHSFADIIEQMMSREVALEVSEAIRAGEETSIPVEINRAEYMLTLKPICTKVGAEPTYYAAFWRSTAATATGQKGASDEVRMALSKARHRIRDLSRDDPVSGLLNAKAFREVLVHDWAVAARENSNLTLICFTLQDFEAYISVFGRHAADSCLRRVSQTIKRCLRRASDVAARIDEDKVIVLSHVTIETGAQDFAEKIAEAVRDLGIHHPRSSVMRFMTVTYKVASEQADKDKDSCKKFLGQLL